MATDIWKIPLDDNGAVRGSYYLRHASVIDDTIGTTQFVNGRSVEPVTGTKLMSIVAAVGADLDLEPADDDARAALGIKSEATKPLPEAAVDGRSSGPEASDVASDESEDRQPKHQSRQEVGGRRGRR